MPRGLRKVKFTRRAMRLEWKRNYSSSIPVSSALEDFTVLQASLSRSDRVLIKLRRTGAENKDKGTAFERLYAVDRIVDAAIAWRVLESERAFDPRKTYFDATLPVFLDDLVIRYADGRIVFVQAKDWQECPWHKVAHDFARQASAARRARQYHRTRYRIVLSRADVHDQTRAAILRTIRSRLTRRSRQRRNIQNLRNVEAIYFDPKTWDLDLIEALMTVSADNYTREDFYTWVGTAWTDARFRGNLYDLVERISRFSSFRTLSLDPDEELDATIDQLLRSVPGLTPKAQCGRLHLDVNGFEKIVDFKIGSPRWEKFDSELRRAKPTTTLELQNVLRRV